MLDFNEVMETERSEEHIHNEALTQEGGHAGQIKVPTNESSSARVSFLEKIIIGILIGFVFLMPIFFLPMSGVFSGFFKNILLAGTVILSLILTFFLWIKDETVILPKSPVFAALFFLVIVYAFSSLLSGSFSNSFFGTGSEITTSFELLLLSVLLFLFAIFFRTRERLLYVFFALLVSSLVVFLFQILHLIFPNLTAFTGLTADKTANLIGQWSDFGIFSGLIAIVSLATLEKFQRIGKGARSALYGFLVIALFFHSMVFYSNSWVILGITSLALSVFVFLGYTAHASTENVSTVKKWLKSPSFIVAVISVLFVFVGPYVNAKLFDILNVSPIQDVRPSWTGTYQVSRGLFAEKNKGVFFGVGPNRFFIPWQKYRPKEVNYTPWWGVDFNEGVGTIPSGAVASGAIGILAWVLFLLLFFFFGLVVLRKRFDKMDAIIQYVTVATFISALYCWVVAFSNVVGSIPFTFAFIFTGLFLGSLGASGLPQVRDYNFAKNPQKGFTLVVILLLLIGSSVAFGYGTIQRTRSFFAYRNAIIAGGVGNFEKADAELQKAILLYPSDAYYRALSAINSYHAEQLLSSKDVSPDQLREQFRTAFQTSIESAKKTVEIDSGNYQNWVSLGGAYSVLVPLGIANVSDDAYIQAKTAYGQAANENPFNPQIPYILARIALSKNQPEEAKNYAKMSLSLKNDYSDALIFLSQLEDTGGQPNEALSEMEGVSAFTFSDPTVLFQLGYLRYKNGKYEEAASALEKAVQAIPNYANAKYFLGLSYSELGRTSDALKEFTDIQSTNPDRTDIAQIIYNLQNGRAPFSKLESVSTETSSLENVSTTTKETAGHIRKR